MTDHTPQSLPDRIYAALEAPIDQWDEAERMGLTIGQHKALRGILMDFFCEWLRDPENRDLIAELAQEAVTISREGV